jgi:long-chain acyl-CoA synthetase
LALICEPNFFTRFLAAVGGGLNLCVSGAAAIDAKIQQVFRRHRHRLFRGYGLTETSPVVSACNYHVNIFGSVGNPTAGIEVAIDTDSDEPGAIGEILTRSESVMLGYYKNPEATAEVMTPDGWFRTGDIGFLDNRGCIHITGRLKSMIVRLTAKRLSLKKIEFLVNRIPGVKESLVWGDVSARDGGVDICAKLVLSSDNRRPMFWLTKRHCLSCSVTISNRLISRCQPIKL